MSHKTALFIGRFQPFHLGHLSVIQEIYPKYAQIIIAIGSSEDSYLPKNPFTASERYEIIRNSLENEGFDLARISIIPVRNINNYALWVKHVELTLPKFDVIYTGSSIVKELFEKDGRFEVQEINKKIKVSASKIRSKILKDEKWENLVPLSTLTYLKSIQGEERIRRIN